MDPSAPSAPPLPAGMSTEFRGVHPLPVAETQPETSRAAVIHENFLPAWRGYETDEAPVHHPYGTTGGSEQFQQNTSSPTDHRSALSAQDSLRGQHAHGHSAPLQMSSEPDRIHGSQPVPSLSSYTVRPQALPSCCCSQSLTKVTGRDRYPPQLQDRQAPDAVCQPTTAELQVLPTMHDPMGRHVLHPYHQAWRFRGLYSSLLVAVLLGTGIAYLIVRHM